MTLQDSSLLVLRLAGDLSEMRSSPACAVFGLRGPPGDVLHLLLWTVGYPRLWRAFQFTGHFDRESGDLTRRSRATTIMYGVLLFCMNVFLCLPLFTLEFGTQFEAGDGAAMSISRWTADHGHGFSWLPSWFGGSPFFHLPALAIPMLVTGLAATTGWTLPHTYHFVLGALYCIGPVSLFCLCCRVTGSRGYAVTAGLFYSLLSPACVVFAAIRHDTANLIEGHNLSFLLRYGLGPHVAAVALVPLFLLALHIALREGRYWSYILAPVVMATIIMSDWPAAIAVIMPVGAYLISRAGMHSRVRWGAVLAIVMSSYLLISPWFPPSAVERLRTNVQQFDPALWDHTALGGIVTLIGGLLILHFWLKSFQGNPWMRFLVFYAFLCTVVTVGRVWFGWHLLPRADQLLAEFDLACCALLAYLGKLFYDRVPRLGRFCLVGLLTIFSAAQLVLLSHYVREQSRGLDIAQVPEYRLSKWLAANRGTSRVYLTGRSGLWLTVFSGNSQVAGCCDDSVPNLQRRMATWMINTGQNAGARDAELSLEWLKAYGADVIVVNGTDYWKPRKFDHMLPVVWRDGDNVVYDLLRRSKSLAHVVSGPQLVSYLPESPLDVEPLTRYVAAIDAEGASRADFVWLDTERAQIDADISNGYYVSVQVSFDQGWRATIDGKTVPTFEDGLGLLVINPQCSGYHRIILTWDGGRERDHTLAMQVLGVLVLIGSYFL